RVRPVVGRDVDLASIVLHVSLGVGVITVHLDQELCGEVDQLCGAGDPSVSELFTVVTHRLCETITGLVCARTDPLNLFSTRRTVVVDRGAPTAVLLFLRFGRHAECADRFRKSSSHCLPLRVIPIATGLLYIRCARSPGTLGRSGVALFCGGGMFEHVIREIKTKKLATK